MALSAEIVVSRYLGNGSNQDFAIAQTLLVNDSAEVVVYKRDESTTPATETLQVEGALQDYTLTGASPPTTPFDNNVHFNAAPAAGIIVVVKRVMPLSQILDLLDGSNYSLTSLELALDRIVAMIQQTNESLQRVPKFDVTSPFTDHDFGMDEPVANQLLSWNAAANRITSVSTTNLGGSSGSALAAHIAATVFGTETQFTLANNQAANSNVTGLVISESTYRAVEILYTIERRTTTQGFRQMGRLICTYDQFAATWSLADLVDFGSSGATTGVAFAISSSGQISYSSDNMSGASYVGKMRYIIRYALLKET